MKLSPWTTQFSKIYSGALKKYQKSARSPKKILTPSQIGFLSSIGITPTTMFDWVEDFAVHGEPDYEVALLLASARREFFLVNQRGKMSKKTIPDESLPPKDGTHAGIVWLPRITIKARGFLHGELSDQTMFCCGGDRHFLKTNRIHPTDFLRLAEQLDGNLDKLARYVKKARKTDH